MRKDFVKSDLEQDEIALVFLRSKGIGYSNESVPEIVFRHDEALDWRYNCVRSPNFIVECFTI